MASETALRAAAARHTARADHLARKGKMLRAAGEQRRAAKYTTLADAKARGR